MFHLVGPEVQDARPRGRAAEPGPNPQQLTSTEVVRVCASMRPRNAQVLGVAPGGWEQETDLTPQIAPGKFL